MIVGLGYKAGSGKDTLADMLVERIGFTKIAFAEPLKEAAKLLCGWDDRHVYGNLKEQVDPFWGFSPRTFLQRLGTDAVRNNIADDFWVKATLRKMKDSTKTKFVVTDVRFPNEANAIREAGGRLFRLDRECAGAGNHASETALDGYQLWDGVIDNNGTLDDLWQQARAKLSI